MVHLVTNTSPGVLTTVVLAAEELKRQGKKIIGLTGGMYDEESFPWREVKEILADATEADWRVMLQYGGTRGYQPLREELSKWMKGHGITVDPYTELMVTTGSQEALDLAARIFLDPGDVIIVGSPTYPSAKLIGWLHLTQPLACTCTGKSGSERACIESLSYPAWLV